MRTLPTLTSVFMVGLCAAATVFTPPARADDWSIGIALPGVIIISPAPEYVPEPPEYYGPAYFPPPRYYGPPVVGYGSYEPGYDDPPRERHHHEDDGGDDDG